MILFPIERVGEVLQEIYNAEINLSLSSFWDAGFTVKIGDESNGWGVPYLQVLSDATNKINYVVSALAYWIYTEMPKSEFTEWYSREVAKFTSKA